VGMPIEQIAEGLRAAVVTRGAHGASLYENGTRIEVPPMPVAEAVDPTGCGDAHRAGLLYGLVEGWSLHDACCLANIMGGLKIGSKGPQNHQPARHEIAAALRSNYGIDAPGES